MASAHPEDLDESLIESPVKNSRNSRDAFGASRKGGESRPTYEDEESRDAALRRELASVRKVNEAIEGVVQNLERAKANMKVATRTPRRKAVLTRRRPSIKLSALLLHYWTLGREFYPRRNITSDLFSTLHGRVPVKTSLISRPMRRRNTKQYKDGRQRSRNGKQPLHGKPTKTRENEQRNLPHRSLRHAHEDELVHEPLRQRGRPLQATA